MAKNVIISVEEAKCRHTKYLTGDKHIKMGDTIVHSLFMSKEDLALISAAGAAGGARLYFAIDNNGTNDYISIITVAVDANYENILTGPGGSLVVNNFDPCPDMCHGSNTSVNDLNHTVHNNVSVWCKPNINPTSHWVDVTGQAVNGVPSLCV